ncbi:MAG: glycosyltransferase family 4 protein [Deltaproteobacteria bacterium]|nr:glycosyltransferase family 4 protein [Deltaproteobacteria bacterium]
MQITHDLAIGGLQQVVVSICKTIDRDRFDVSVLCLRELGDFAGDVRRLGIKVIHLPQKKGGVDYLSFLKVAWVLRRERTEIIHTHNTQPFIDGTIGALMSGVKTIVHTDHGRPFPDKRRYMLAERLMSHFAYRVVGVSDYTSQALIKYEKISPAKVVTIINGIDMSKYDIHVDKAKKRRELGITNEGQVIGVGARLVEQKGLQYLIRAMPAIIREFPGITLVIAGEGAYAQTLKNEARGAGVDGSVIFAGPRLDMPELLKLFDVYVLPSLWEGLPMVILEAMASGCPVIATNVGGISMAIEHEKNGLLVAPGDPAPLSREIIRLLRDRELGGLYSARSLKIFKERFSAEIMTKKYQGLYLRET